MVKLTPELIEQSAQFTNAVRDRELDLRGYKIPIIENLGATLDQFDTIDFTDNDIRKLDGFPLLKRLKNLLLSNNRVVRVAESLEESIPNLETLVLSNNTLQELGDLDPLASLKNLKTLSLLRNPVTVKKHYRLYVIHKLPQVRLLDFRKVRQREREAAQQMFKGKRGQQLAREIGKRAKTFVPGAGIPEKKQQPSGPSKEEMDAIKAAIANAKTLEEVEKLNQMLRSGQIPGSIKKAIAGQLKYEDYREGSMLSDLLTLLPLDDTQPAVSSCFATCAEAEEDEMEMEMTNGQ